MLLFAYKALMKRSTPLLEAYLRHRLSRGKEDLARAHERRGQPTRQRGSLPLVWFHAASVGESLSLLALVQKMLNDHPEIEALVTTGTVTSAKLMAERLPSRAFHQYIPVDHPDWVESFLDHWKPNLVIWAESELWPNMLMGIQARRIPAVLLNARMSEKSFKRWQMVKNDIGTLLKTFHLCLAQNQAEADRLVSLGASSVKVSGNLKYAAAPLPHDPAKLDALKKAIGMRPYVLFASTHRGEEEIACRLHKELKTAAPNLLTIIVPRHPQRGEEITMLAVKAGLAATLRSTGALPKNNDDIYIADTLGELGLFYRLCCLCVLGGSFVPVGGHNPIEPGQLGCQIFYGPHMFNFISMSEEFEKHGAALRVADEAELKEKLALGLKNPSHFAGMAEAARKWTQQQSHVVDAIAADIAPLFQIRKDLAA